MNYYEQELMDHVRTDLLKDRAITEALATFEALFERKDDPFNPQYKDGEGI